MVENIKNFIARFTKRTLIIVASIVLGILVLAIVVSIVLNGKSSTYSTLFSKMSQEDAQDVIRLLQDNNISYKYENDNILVKKSAHDKTMAMIAANGYPSTGFAYEIAGKAGSMATDSDKRRYELYDLQNRIGAIIRMLDGVQDAKVTIALSEESKYVLTKNDDIPATASVLVRMRDGGSPSPSQVAAIQRLLSTSIRGVSMGNVAVIDGNGNDVSVVLEDGEKADTQNLSDMSNATSIKADMEKVVEKHIADNVLAVFNPLYGKGNVQVVAKAKVNMNSAIREAITYSVPEKIDENDKKGLIVRESGSNASQNLNNGAEGVVGTETNAEIPEYNTQENQNDTNLSNYQFAREYLVNQVKEQGSVPGGAIEDLSLSVSINAKNYGDLPYDSLVNLAGNAAGIAPENREAKITIVSAEFPKSEQPPAFVEKSGSIFVKLPFFVWAISGAFLMLLLFLIAFLVIRKNRMLRQLEMAAIEAENSYVAAGALPPLEAYNSEYDEEKIMIQNDRGMGLRRDVREFADKNPEIAARLLKSWLNTGGDENAK